MTPSHPCNLSGTAVNWAQLQCCKQHHRLCKGRNNTTGLFYCCWSNIDLKCKSNPTWKFQNVNNGNSPANFTVARAWQHQFNKFCNHWTKHPIRLVDLPNGSTATGINYNSTNADPTIHDGLWTVTVTDANGCTDTDVITITVTPNPSNDDCANAIAVNLATILVLPIFVLPTIKHHAPFALNQASVWYEYAIGPGIKTLTVSVSGSNHVVEIYEDNCNASLAGDCDNSVTLDCRNLKPLPSL